MPFYPSISTNISSMTRHLKLSYISILTNLLHMVFTAEVFFEVALESWPEWDLNPRTLNSVQTL